MAASLGGTPRGYELKRPKPERETEPEPESLGGTPRGYELKRRPEGRRGGGGRLVSGAPPGAMS